MWSKTPAYRPNYQFARPSSAKKEVNPEEAVQGAFYKIVDKFKDFSNEAERIRREFADEPAAHEIKRKSAEFYGEVGAIIRKSQGGHFTIRTPKKPNRDPSLDFREHVEQLISPQDGAHSPKRLANQAESVQDRSPAATRNLKWWNACSPALKTRPCSSNGCLSQKLDSSLWVFDLE